MWIDVNIWQMWKWHNWQPAQPAQSCRSRRRSPPAPSTSSRRRSYSAPTSYQPRRRTMTVSPRRRAARRRAPPPPAPAPVNTRRRTSSINGQTSLWFQVLGVGRWNGNWMILLYHYCYMFIAVISLFYIFSEAWFVLLGGGYVAMYALTIHFVCKESMLCWHIPKSIALQLLRYFIIIMHNYSADTLWTSI